MSDHDAALPQSIDHPDFKIIHQARSRSELWVTGPDHADDPASDNLFLCIMANPDCHDGEGRQCVSFTLTPAEAVALARRLLQTPTQRDAATWTGA
jgi:hypothetical protein